MDHYCIRGNLCSINTLKISFLWSLANWLYSFWLWKMHFASDHWQYGEKQPSFLLLKFFGFHKLNRATRQWDGYDQAPGQKPYCSILAAVLHTDVGINTWTAGSQCWCIVRVIGKKTMLDSEGQRESALESVCWDTSKGISRSWFPIVEINRNLVHVQTSRNNPLGNIVIRAWLNKEEHGILSCLSMGEKVNF